MATRPDPALVLAMLEARADHQSKSLDGWTVVHVSKTPRQAVVVLEREVEEGPGVHSEYIFETTEGRWRLRGGSGGSTRPASQDQPRHQDSPVAFRGITTIFGRRPHETTLRVAGGRARTDVAQVVVLRDSVTFNIVPDERGWFHVILEGSEAATITAVSTDGKPVLDRDGLPVTLRLERLS